MSVMKQLASFGPANRIARSEETHPLTWRLRDDGQPGLVVGPPLRGAAALPAQLDGPPQHVLGLAEGGVVGSGRRHPPMLGRP